MQIRFIFPELVDKIYFDDFVPIAEGLRELGIEFTANTNYWQSDVDGTHLFRNVDCNESDDFIVEVHSYRSLRYFDEAGAPQPGQQTIGKPRRNSFRVLIDLDDGYKTPAFEHHLKFDLILRCKFNSMAFHPSNFHPWAYGYSDRVARMTLPRLRPFYDRKRTAMVNFGASHSFSHGTRELFSHRFMDAAKRHVAVDQTKDDLSQSPKQDWDRLMWSQTQRLHNPNYYHRLCESQSVAAFCGEMIPPLPFNPTYLAGGNRAKLLRGVYGALGALTRRTPRSIQWDSWRFWEGLAAGCLVFNIDLEYYGVTLPVMPVNGVHYIGLRLETIEQQVSDVLQDQDRMAEIAENGHAWAMSHYSPMGLAKQFLSIIESERGR